jgi:hypothetical protein|tara:strand:+ start:3770 stop:3895 length:126 start_codon:yes stop_codon:yes gene_type:complete
MGKAKGFGVNDHVKGKRRKRPGRHSKKHKGRKKIERSQGHP